jgi:cellulose synthase (UDP-forming)
MSQKKSSFEHEKVPANFINQNSYLLVSVFSVALFLTVAFLLGFSFILIVKNDYYSVFDRILSVILLLSLVFWSLHSIGYMDHYLKSILIYKSKLRINYMNSRNPGVAVLIPVLNESPDIVRAVLSKSIKINYPNFEIYLIESSKDREICKETFKIARELQVNFIRRRTLRGYKAGSINDAIKELGDDVEYILLLDVDHLPKPNFLKDLIPLLDENPDLSFIQTPQFFTGNKYDKLSLVYSFQQHIFYKHMCRGLDVNNTTLICGTNVIIRLSHLNEVGGLDENCITEDVATSFSLHSKGYKSIYIDHVYAEGLSPPSLSAYYIQQTRWAYGTFQNVKNVIKQFITHPKRLKTVQWWEYLILHGTWYFMGFAMFLWVIYPILILLLNIQPLKSGLTSITFIIFIILLGCQFYTGTSERDFKIKDLILAQGLFLSLFTVYINAFFMVLFRKNIGFRVTPKKRTDPISFFKMLPQLIILFLLLISIFVGIGELLSGDYSITNVMGWAIYDTVILSFMGYFYWEDIRKGKSKN